MPTMCFIYQPDLPQGIGTRAAAPPALRRMPEAGPCFSYMVDVPQPVSAGWLACFSYSADAPQPAPPGLRRMVVWHLLQVLTGPCGSSAFSKTGGEYAQHTSVSAIRQARHCAAGTAVPRAESIRRA